MRFTQQLIKTTKEKPRDEVSRNADLLIRAGFIDKTMAGVYTLLPLGLRVLRNVNHIIREEMDALGAEELLMPALQPRELWETTGRWNNFDALYRVHSHDGSHEFGLGPTHEEVVTPLVKKFVHSYRDLPRAVYQIQTKYRFEARAKSGILRGREFMMKDLYSFHTTPEDLQIFYDRAAGAYARIFERVGLPAHKVRASGGTFSKFSEEFQVFADAGEDTIFYCTCGFAENKEIASVAEGDACPLCARDRVRAAKAIEVGNIFSLNTKFSEPFGFDVVGEHDERSSVFMGCYGIGCTRIVGTLAEVLSDERGLVWPVSVAPYRIHLVRIGDDAVVCEQADAVYKQLCARGVTVLYDDRSTVAAGEKFADADLMGIPERVVISSKTVAAQSVEVKARTDERGALFPVREFLDRAYV